VWSILNGLRYCIDHLALESQPAWLLARAT
jgi:hypothetical protein